MEKNWLTEQLESASKTVNNWSATKQEVYSLGKKQSGFEDIPQPEICRHPEHNPPSHICIPQGKQYRHVCPACGKETILRPPTVTL